MAAARAERDACKGKIQLVDVGQALFVETSGLSSVFRVSPPENLPPDQGQSELFLASGEPGAKRHRVAQVRLLSKTEIIVVVIGEHDEINEQQPLRLFAQIDPALIADAFVRYLESVEKADLADGLVEAARLSDGAGPEGPSELNDQQRQAVGALLSSGLHVVWGPPGTGKTRVIGEAVARMLARGKTVALVSNTNVAVDQALLHVVRCVDDWIPGLVVRVGHASVSDVLSHPSLTVEKAAEFRSRALVEKLESEECSLKELRLDPLLVSANEFFLVVGTKTETDLLELQERQAKTARLPKLELEIGIVQANLERSKSAQHSIGKKFDQATVLVDALGDQTDLLEAARSLSVAREALAKAQGEVAVLGKKHEEASNAGWLTRRREHKAIEQELKILDGRCQGLKGELSRCETIFAAAAAKGIQVHEIRSLEVAKRAAKKIGRKPKSNRGFWTRHSVPFARSTLNSWSCLRLRPSIVTFSR